MKQSSISKQKMHASAKKDEKPTSINVVTSTMSHSNKTAGGKWPDKEAVIILSVLFLVAILVTVIAIVLLNKNKVTPITVDTNTQEYIDGVTGKNSTKSEQIIAKSDATSALGAGSDATTVSQSDTSFSTFEEATTKASLYYDAGDYTKALNVYVIADGLPGTKTYVFYERVGITAQKAGNKQEAVNYFQKAKNAVTSDTSLESLTVSNAQQYYDSKISELSK